jgi:hypothetical protein
MDASVRLIDGEFVQVVKVLEMPAVSVEVPAPEGSSLEVTQLLVKAGVDDVVAATEAVAALIADGKLPVNVAALPALAAGTNNIGDVDVASIAAGTNTIGATRDAGPSQTVTRTFTQNDDISTARDITAAPTSGQKIVALDVYVSVDTACYVTIQMETSSNVLAGAYCAANSIVPFTLRGYLKGDAADKKLQMKSSVASKGACTAVYFSEA